MTFNSTYDEYCWLRVQNGWEPEYAMVREVWEGCTQESQENMLEQLRVPLRYRDRYVERHGDVW